MNSILGLIHSTYKKRRRKKKFTDKEKRLLRPIAEVIAILDGNAFWGLTINQNGQDNWYEQYLLEAWMIYMSNPSVLDGTSWVREQEHENPAVADAYNTWQLLKILSRSTN